MKKLLGTCLAAAAICAFGFGSASAVNWQVFGQDSAGITWSIDQDSVQKSDKTATVMIKAQDSVASIPLNSSEFIILPSSSITSIISIPYFVANSLSLSSCAGTPIIAPVP